MCRSSAAGRPPLGWAGRGGIKGRTRSHNSSLTSHGRVRAMFLFHLIAFLFSLYHWFSDKVLVGAYNNYEESLALARALGDQELLVNCMEGLAMVVSMQG